MGDQNPVTRLEDVGFRGLDHRADTFVAKVNAQGTDLEYCGYIGGTQNDYGRGIALDLVELGGNLRKGILPPVDRVVGSHQTVIKPLGDIYKSVECISGATILGDGNVALILDPARLAQATRTYGKGQEE